MTQTTTSNLTDGMMSESNQQRFIKESGQYVRRIRNRSKRAYAELVRTAMINHLRYGTPIAITPPRGDRGLTFMATQAVWMRLGAMRQNAS